MLKVKRQLAAQQDRVDSLGVRVPTQARTSTDGVLRQAKAEVPEVGEAEVAVELCEVAAAADGEAAGAEDAALGAFTAEGAEAAEAAEAATPATVMAALGVGKQFQRWSFQPDVLLAAKFKLSWRGGVVCDHTGGSIQWRLHQLGLTLETMPSVTRFRGRLILAFPGGAGKRARVWVEAAATAPTATSTRAVAASAAGELEGPRDEEAEGEAEEAEEEEEEDVIDDGFRWRNCGQHFVKGSTHPRSYYKCATAGCAARKKVPPPYPPCFAMFTP
jgi:hypothetical protein